MLFSLQRSRTRNFWIRPFSSRTRSRVSTDAAASPTTSSSASSSTRTSRPGLRWPSTHSPTINTCETSRCSIWRTAVPWSWSCCRSTRTRKTAPVSRPTSTASTCTAGLADLPSSRTTSAGISTTSRCQGCGTISTASASPAGTRSGSSVSCIRLGFECVCEKLKLLIRCT